MSPADRIAIAVGVIALATAALAIARSLRKFLRKFDTFLADWQGTPARPGVPCRPGVLERLSIGEVFQQDITTRLTGIEARLPRREEH